MSGDRISDIFLPTSPTMTTALFGSAPRARRPSNPKSPPAELPPPSSQPRTPRADKELPSIPRSKSKTKTKTTSKGASGRPDSPDVETMIARTPRPRRRSSAVFSPTIARVRSNGSMAVPSSWKGVKNKASFPDAEDNDSLANLEVETPVAQAKEDKLEREHAEDSDGEGSESDSSIDIHTPLPHLMFRDGLLSPRSKLLPCGASSTLSIYMDDDDASPGDRANSVLSVASTAASTMTKSGIYRDPRDTERRRVRHRDQQLLRAGMGLTTGLGWSDSEDEDAPSLLTRRLITTNIERQPSMYASVSRAPSQLAKSVSTGNISHAPPSYSPVPRSTSRALSRSTSASFSHSRLSTADSDSVTSADARLPSRSRTQSNASASSIVSSGSRDSNSNTSQSVTTPQNTPSRATAVPRPLRLPQTQHKKGASAHSVTRSVSITTSRPVAAAAVAATTGSAARQRQQRPRTRTLSNPGSRPALLSPPPGRSPAVSSSASASSPARIAPAHRAVSVSAAVMAPVRPAYPLSAASFPLPPTSRPSVNTQIAIASGGAGGAPQSAPPTQLRNTVGTGLRVPRPRTGTGMVYRISSYADAGADAGGGGFYDGSRISRASSNGGKQVGVI